MAEPGPPDPQRIVVRGVNWLGDAVMTMPALQRLRERFPETHISMVAPEKLSPLWQLHAAVNQVIAFGQAEGLLGVARRIRTQQADLGLVLPNSARSGLEMLLGRVPVRVGFAAVWRNFSLTRNVARGSQAVRMRKRSKSEVFARIRHNAPRETWPVAAHQIDEYLRLVSVLGANPEPVAPALAIPRSAIQAAAEKFGLTGPVPGARTLLGLNPGAEYGPAKRWPAERFVQTAVSLSRRLNCAWLLLGGKGDVEVTTKIADGIERTGAPVVNVAGKTSLPELCAVLGLCRAVLTNDTGPMHLAAAVGTPVVVPFGSTAPELTGPGLPGDVRHKIIPGQAPCAPCFRRECPVDLRCLKQITPEQVAEAMCALVSVQ